MDGVKKIKGFGFALGFALNSIGQLPRATLWMARQAALAQPMSLRALNHSLVSGGRPMYRSKASGVRMKH